MYSHKREQLNIQMDVSPNEATTKSIIIHYFLNTPKKNNIKKTD